MSAFDTDILSGILYANPVYTARLAAIPQADRVLPVVALEEVLRGRLNSIRRAQAANSRITPDRAYFMFQAACEDTRPYRILPYTAAADTFFKQWRTKIRIGTQDLRIAAICLVHGARLITRNARDYALVPSLNLEIWN